MTRSTHPAAFAPELDIEHFQPVAAGNAPARAPQTCSSDVRSVGHDSVQRIGPETQKVGTSPLRVLPQSPNSKSIAQAMPFHPAARSAPGRTGVAGRSGVDGRIGRSPEQPTISASPGCRRAYRRRVALGQVDDGIDVGRLRNRAGRAAPVRDRRAGRRPSAATVCADQAFRRRPPTMLLLQPHDPRLARRLGRAPARRRRGREREVPSSCE